MDTTITSRQCVVLRVIREHFADANFGPRMIGRYLPGMSFKVINKQITALTGNGRISHVRYGIYRLNKDL